MNHNNEDPDFLGGHGDMLPADVLKKLDELLELLHQKNHISQGSIVFNIYGKGSQHIDKQFNIGAYSRTLLKGKGEKEAYPDPPEGREKGMSNLPEVLATDEAMELWKKAQQAGYVDEQYQPLISRTQAALLADAMAERLGIKEKWKVFEGLWNRNNMYRDYYKALNLHQSLAFQDKIKKLFR